MPSDQKSTKNLLSDQEIKKKMLVIEVKGKSRQTFGLSIDHITAVGHAEGVGQKVQHPWHPY